MVPRLHLNREPALTVPKFPVRPGIPPGVSLLAAAALLLAAALPLADPLHAQVPVLPEGPDAPVHLVPRLDAPLILDGNVDKPAWQAIEPLHAVVHTPDFGAVPSEPTEFRMAHDGEYLYFSCFALDSSPDLIQATSFRRNDASFNSDRCSIYMDTLNDEENALGFGSTPAGIRTDLNWANDAQGPPNFDWNSFWDVVVTQDHRGWHAEFRIPFSSLIFQEVDGRVTMGFALLRTTARRNEMTTHPAMSPAFGFSSFGKPSRMRKMVLEGVESSRPVYVTPYVLGGRGHTHTLSAAEEGFLRRSERTGEVGIDLRTSLTSNLTLDLTLNTDFAQVEADDQQVNLTRFPLFFPEKRRFFQERNVLFEYSLGGQERLFHSRRIGLVAGEPVRIYGGARLVGRVGEWDVGFLNMQTAESARLPSENLGVVRLRRRVINPNSYLGGIVTSRTDADGAYNVVVGLDAIVRVVGDDYLTVNGSQSFDSRLSADGGLLDNGLLRVNWQRRGQDFLNYTLTLARVGEVFEPGMGFLRRRDYTQVDGGIGYGWRRTGPEHRVIRTSLNLNGGVFVRGEDDELETAELSLRGSLELRSGHQWTLTLPWTHESLGVPLQLPSGTSVPVGEYRFVSAQLQYSPPSSYLFRPSGSIEVGQFFDGRQLSVNLSPSWAISRQFSLGGTYRLDHVSLPERDERFTAHVARIRGEVMFSTTTSIASFVQYNSTADAVIANVRFRYNPREGNDLYIVWNEGLNTDLDAYEPVRPRSEARTLLVKYSHTLTLGF